MTEDSFRDTVGPLEPAELARVRVRAGMRLLDANRPGWRNAVDVDALELESEHDCILGQVFAEDAFTVGAYSGFGFGAKYLGLEIEASFGPRLDTAALVKYGFDVDVIDVDGPDYPTLEAAWVDALEGTDPNDAADIAAGFSERTEA